MTSQARYEPHPLALLGHELRTPLNAVLGYADAWRLEAFGPLPEPYREQAALVHAAASHLLALVDAMTDIAAVEAGVRPLSLEPLGGSALKTLLADAARLLAPRARAANLELRVSADAPAVEIRADPVALTQILVNLIDNAVKFAAPGGTISVATRATGRDLLLVVENHGGLGHPSVGAGTGLGLRLVDTLSTSMGGGLTLEVSPGGEARAVVRLPAAAPPPRP